MTPDPIKRQPHTVPAMSDGLDPLRTYPSIPPATVHQIQMQDAMNREVPLFVEEYMLSLANDVDDMGVMCSVRGQKIRFSDGRPPRTPNNLCYSPPFSSLMAACALCTLTCSLCYRIQQPC